MLILAFSRRCARYWVGPARGAHYQLILGYMRNIRRECSRAAQLYNPLRPPALLSFTLHPLSYALIFKSNLERDVRNRYTEHMIQMWICDTEGVFTLTVWHTRNIAGVPFGISINDKHNIKWWRCMAGHWIPCYGWVKWWRMLTGWS